MTATRAPSCAVCAKRTPDPAYRPFCSKRCADIDLGRWLDDRYAIPGLDAEAKDDRPGARVPEED